jgi:uroporphyrinogen-III synthase
VDEIAQTALRGKRIVVTRARKQSEPLAEALRRVKADPVVLPLVEFAEPSDIQALDRAVHSLSSEFDWVLLTSQNAVAAVANSAERQKIALRATARGVAVGCVGPATAGAARAAGLAVRHVAATHDGVSLAKELAGKLSDARVLLPRSDLANPELTHLLAEAGARVTEIVAYRTAAPSSLASDVQQAFAAGSPDVVLFFSPSAVTNLRGAMSSDSFAELARSAVFTAIGPVTEQALRKAGVERILKSKEQSAVGVIDTLVEYFVAKDSSNSAGAQRA